MPLLGDQVRLLEDWSFPLYAEHRNGSLAIALGIVPKPRERYFWWYEYVTEKDEHGYVVSHGCKEYPVTLPAGTVLQLDRIYIRKGSEDYDSLTFLIVDSPNDVLKPWKKIKTGAKSASNGAIRFWTKMSDINDKASVEWLSEKVPFGYRKENASLHGVPEKETVSYMPVEGHKL
jgi:hypothetical protein